MLFLAVVGIKQSLQCNENNTSKVVVCQKVLRFPLLFAMKALVHLLIVHLN